MHASCARAALRGRRRKIGVVGCAVDWECCIQGAPLWRWGRHDRDGARAAHVDVPRIRTSMRDCRGSTRARALSYNVLQWVRQCNGIRPRTPAHARARPRTPAATGARSLHMLADMWHLPSSQRQNRHETPRTPWIEDEGGPGVCHLIIRSPESETERFGLRTTTLVFLVRCNS